MSATEPSLGRENKRKSLLAPVPLASPPLARADVLRARVHVARVGPERGVRVPAIRPITVCKKEYTSHCESTFLIAQPRRLSLRRANSEFQKLGMRGGTPGCAGPSRNSRSASAPKLKGSIGEGSNHSNFSHQSSVKILTSEQNSVKIQCILLENSKKSGFFNIFENICELPTKFHQTHCKMI